ncbi:MAG: hypothetical protein PWP25_589 [Sphaerochaeta sp.]|jgi:hypothetical protein|nr:hypothetical protein [Sphaerochaeta sp.]MDN5334069.1 hypothetical protein [Sphaerochaeta sp.]
MISFLFSYFTRKYIYKSPISEKIVYNKPQLGTLVATSIAEVTNTVIHCKV